MSESSGAAYDTTFRVFQNNGVGFCEKTAVRFLSSDMDTVVEATLGLATPEPSQREKI